MMLGLTAVVILALIALVHVYWALGGQIGLAAAIPNRAAVEDPVGSFPSATDEPLFKPGLFATLFVACALAAACVLLLAMLSVITLPVPRWLLDVGGWVLGGVFLVRAIGDFRYVGFFKKVMGTPFAKMDTRVYSPLCVFLGAVCIFVAISGQ
jgi:hypothetical protein